MRLSAITVIALCSVWAACTAPTQSGLDNRETDIIDYHINNPVSQRLTGRITAIAPAPSDTESQVLVGTDQGEVYSVNTQTGTSSLFWSLGRKEAIYQIIVPPSGGQILFSVGGQAIWSRGGEPYRIHVPAEDDPDHKKETEYSAYATMTAVRKTTGEEVLLSATSNGVYMFPPGARDGTLLLYDANTDSNRFYSLFYSKKQDAVYTAGESGLVRISLSEPSDTSWIDRAPCNYLDTYDSVHAYCLFKDGSVALLNTEAPSPKSLARIYQFTGTPKIVLHSRDGSSPEKNRLIALGIGTIQVEGKDKVWNYDPGFIQRLEGIRSFAIYKDHTVFTGESAPN